LSMALVTGAMASAATNAERRLAREIAQRYLPGDVARQIERQPGLLEVHGRRVALAIVFTDLADFTTLSEQMEPEQLGAVLNGYLDGMTEVALRHGATLDKFIGDAVVCFWGAPIEDPLAAQRALSAALAMQAFAESHRAEMHARNIPIGRTRIGAHYGEAVVGNFGSRRRVQYTAMGDAMNLASRLESANKHLGTQILASEQIIGSAGWTKARELGLITVKGRAEPCRIYELDDRLTGEMAMAHRTLVENLRAGVAGADDELMRRLRETPDDVALAQWAERGNRVGWNGVWPLESK
jgi:adenylate cyclase